MYTRLSLLLLASACQTANDTGPSNDTYVHGIQLSSDGDARLACDQESLQLSWTLSADGDPEVTVQVTNETPELGTLTDDLRFVRGDAPGEAKVRVEVLENPGVADDLTIHLEGHRRLDFAPGEPLEFTQLCPGGEVHLAPGVYTQRFSIDRPLVMMGPDTSPPTAIIRPTSSYIFGAMVSIDPHGNEGDLEVTLQNLEIDGSGLEDIVYEPSSYRWMAGVAVSGGARAHFDRVRFTGLTDDTPGRYNGIGIDMIDSEVQVDDCTFDRVGYRAIDTRSIDGIATGRLDVRNSTFIGEDPAVSGGSAVQYGITMWGAIEGEITGNSFVDFGPAGPVTPDGTLLVPDTNVGYAVEMRGLTAGPGAVTVQGNRFERVQGVFFDDRLFLEPASALRSDTFLADNTVQGPYLMAGTPSQSSRLHGQRDDDPNHVNVLLESIACINYDPCAVTLSAGTYTLTEPLFEPLWAIELRATGGPVVLQVPGGALPAEITLGPDVSLAAAQ